MLAESDAELVVGASIDDVLAAAADADAILNSYLPGSIGALEAPDHSPAPGWGSTTSTWRRLVKRGRRDR